MLYRTTLSLFLLIIITPLQANAEETKVTDLDSYSKFIHNAKPNREVWKAYPEKQEQMNYLLREIYTKAPTKVIVQSKTVPINALQEMYYRSEEKYHYF